MPKPSTNPEPATIAIYELQDPRDNRVYYVGKSHQPKTRYHQHLKDAAARPGTAKAAWITRLRAAGKRPTLNIAAYVPDSHWRDAEAKAILEHLQSGSPLTNDLIPGDRRSGPRVNMRSQDFWDDLTPQFPELQRRVVIFQTAEGLAPHFWWNYENRGWREYQTAYHASGSTLLTHEQWGFNRHADIVEAINWRAEALLARHYASTMYDTSVPLDELYSHEQLQGSGMAHAVG